MTIFRSDELDIFTSDYSLVSYTTFWSQKCCCTFPS